MLLLGASCARIPPGSRENGTPADAPRPDRIVVITDYNYPPYVLTRSDGSLEGIIPDLWREWEQATGIPVEILAFPWAEAQERFTDGEGDVIETIFDTPERRKHLAFSKPYARIPVPIFTHSSITGISGPEDLRGFKVAVKSGDAAIAELIRLDVSDLSLYKSYEDILLAAAQHEVRVFCADRPPAYHYLYKLKLDREFREAFVLNEGAFSRAVRLGDEPLLALIQNGFASIPRKSVDAVDRRWMGRELPRLADPRLALGLGFAAALLLAFLAGTAANLRHRVGRATEDLKEKVALLQAGEERIKKALREKEILLQEVHHRVKNNLQIISSLLHLQSEDLRSEEARDLLLGTQSRILAMADLHDRLYTSADLEEIDADEYLRALLDNLATTFGFHGFEYQGRPLSVSIETALPLGLIVNEWAINAAKYAYPGREPGVVEIRLCEYQGECVCSIRDFGRGLPPGLDPDTATSLGFTIVRSLAAQLRGGLRFGQPPGFSAELRFPFPARERATAEDPGTPPKPAP